LLDGVTTTRGRVRRFAQRREIAMTRDDSAASRNFVRRTRRGGAGFAAALSLFGIAAVAGCGGEGDVGSATTDGDEPVAALPGPTGVDIAAARAVHETEPPATLTPAQAAQLAAKDEAARAHVSSVRQGLPAVGVLASVPPCDPDCTPKIRSNAANQQAQKNSYYCGPATLSEMAGARGVSVSQDTAATKDNLNTVNLGQTPWYNGGGDYPMARVLNKYLGQFYVPVNLQGSPSAADKTAYRARLVSDIDDGWDIAGNAYEVAGGPHLVGHPNALIMHWFAIRGYDDYGATTLYEDSVHGCSQISYQASVPAYSAMSSDTIAVIMGGRGYIW
jgi:hypothetical protein